MVQEGREGRINITLTPKVLKKLESVSRKNGDSKSLIVEAALLQFFTSPGVFESFIKSDKSFRYMLPSSVFHLAKACGWLEGDAAELAIEQQEVNKDEIIEEYLEKQTWTNIPDGENEE